jgi:hypothetical protein
MISHHVVLVPAATTSAAQLPRIGATTVVVVHDNTHTKMKPKIFSFDFEIEN